MPGLGTIILFALTLFQLYEGMIPSIRHFDSIFRDMRVLCHNKHAERCPVDTNIMLARVRREDSVALGIGVGRSTKKCNNQPTRYPRAIQRGSDVNLERSLCSLKQDSRYSIYCGYPMCFGVVTFSGLFLRATMRSHQ